jgi:hypothetical protein
MQDANTWLNNMFNDEDNTWIPDTAHDESSPATSVADEPHSATGKVFKRCKCPTQQHIYDDWPTHDAELTIAKCMTILLDAEVNVNARRGEYGIVRECAASGISDTKVVTVLFDAYVAAVARVPELLPDPS